MFYDHINTFKFCFNLDEIYVSIFLNENQLIKKKRIAFCILNLFFKENTTRTNLNKKKYIYGRIVNSCPIFDVPRSSKYFRPDLFPISGSFP